jgi:hypothetical protein
MSGFYHHLQTGATRDEALRRAKLRFMQSGGAFSDPHFWAAFVLTGDGARPISRALPWSYVFAMVAMLGLVAGLFEMQRRHRLDPQRAPRR